MSKQLKKLSYEPETITINVVGETTTDSGTLTISQIKVLLENVNNTITYKTSANYSEVLHLAQADYENSTAPKATYTADYYDSSTNVYYKHIIVVSYNTLFNSATWVFVSAPMVSGSSSDLQEKLVSGTNIKTVNNNSLLGSGNLAISEFPERSETDATLAQIAGLNSQGNPDVGKVAAGNMDSGSATAGQVLTADGSGGCAWANAGGGGGETYVMTGGYITLTGNNASNCIWYYNNTGIVKLNSPLASTYFDNTDKLYFSYGSIRHVTITTNKEVDVIYSNTQGEIYKITIPANTPTTLNAFYSSSAYGYILFKNVGTSITIEYYED